MQLSNCSPTQHAPRQPSGNLPLSAAFPPPPQTNALSQLIFFTLPALHQRKARIHTQKWTLPHPPNPTSPSSTTSPPPKNTPFDQEFALLALSQAWTPGSQQYTKQRTIALREELKTHYFSSQSQSQPSNSSDQSTQQLTEEEILKGYQDLCIEVDIAPSPSVMECKRQLRKKLVNIVDLIDARRTGSRVRVWRDFDAFRAYTLKDEHRINRDEAKQDGGFLASLLQHLRNPRGQRRARMKRTAMAKRG